MLHDNTIGLHRKMGFLVFAAVVFVAACLGSLRLDSYLGEQADERAVALLQLEARYLLANFERVAATIAAYLDGVLVDLSPDEESIRASIALMRPTGPIIQISFIDDDGALLASTHPIAEPVDLRDREHFRVHSENRVLADGLYISAPVLGRVSGRYSIQFSRAFRDAQGRFLGVLVASYDAEQFVYTYEQFPTHEGRLIVLTGFDGIVRTRSVQGGESAFGFPVPHRDLHEEVVAGGSRAISFTSPMDGVTRVGFAQVSERYPFYLLVADDLEKIRPATSLYIVALWSVAGLLISLALGALVYTRYLDMLFENRIYRARLENGARVAEVARLGALGELAAGLGHEVSTPANTIVQATENLEKQLRAQGGLTPSVAEKLDRIRRSSDRIGTLMDAVRGHARTAAPDETCEAGKAIANALLLVGQQLRDEQIEIVEQPGPPAVLPLAQRELESVVINILLNARDAIVETSPLLRRVTIRTEREGEMLRIEIEDSGGGIAPEVRRKMFQPFFTTKPVGRGSGIGLATAYRIVTARGGSIEAHNRSWGACLTFTLPVREWKGGNSASSASADNGRNKKLLNKT